MRPSATAPASSASTTAGVVGRLAPSPTGAQHVGNARTYLLAWLAARSCGGRLILRMEDLDSPRVKPGAERLAMEDLYWLGLDWDEGPDRGGPGGPYRQSARGAYYDAALQRLQQHERVYPCNCTRSEIAQAASAPHAGQDAPVYAGRCASRSVRDASPELEPFGWRFRVPDQPMQLIDRIAGRCTCVPSQQLGDFVVAKSDGTPSYQLAVVVDDHAMGVNQVVRGDDLLPSAFRQSLLYQFFGWDVPQWCHVPLVVGADGRRLAKRHGDTRLVVLRQRGVPPERLLGLLAWSCGFIDRLCPLTLSEILPLFCWERIPRQPFVFKAEHWQWLLNE